MIDRINYPQENIKYTEFWIPTKQSAEKIKLMNVEASINISNKNLDSRTMFEDVLIRKNIENIFNRVPEIKISVFYKEFKKMLSLKPQNFKYASVYSKTGGLLNIFNPTIKESMDKELNLQINSYEDKEKAINIWKDTKSELWSDLTPKLVWAGTGKLEIELSNDFFSYLSSIVNNRPFNTEGEMVLEALKALRGWQVAPNRICGGLKPMDAIAQEREKIYVRKINLIRELGIECDF